MPVFLVSDIFGRTPALDTVCSTLSRAAPDIRIIDPYTGRDHGFETEAAAYDYFMDRVGLTNYQSILAERMTASGPGTVLIGFSVGAAAIWGISGTASLTNIQKAFCFYGSQIRHKTGISPLLDMALIFPEKEPHFDVDVLIKYLNKKNNVTCTKAPALHGFMNEKSPHFDPACYAVFIDYLKTSLVQLNR